MGFNALFLSYSAFKCAIAECCSEVEMFMKVCDCDGHPSAAIHELAQLDRYLLTGNTPHLYIIIESILYHSWLMILLHPWTELL